ncbi:translation initiation factor IF-3 [Candidatus Uhrbacteria bacterium]|nr:translation initiation factor IF-3 [Candidatus Uhrbacteria bacterium]
MRKNYRRAAPVPQTKSYRTNRAITAPEVRLLDENDEHIGVVPLEEALRRAAESELDLIEIEPKANPPVCRIMDHGRLKYSLEKEMRKQKARQKKVEVKGIRLSLRIGAHDREMRINQSKKFLEQNDKVKIEMALRGRERAHADLARTIISQFIESVKASVEGTIVIESPVSVQGGRLNTIIGLKK